MYHYIIVSIVMRDCDSETDARRQCTKLLPCHPDETTQYMESWEIVKVDEVVIRRTIPPEHAEYLK